MNVLSDKRLTIQSYYGNERGYVANSKLFGWRLSVYPRVWINMKAWMRFQWESRIEMCVILKVTKTQKLKWNVCGLIYLVTFWGDSRKLHVQTASNYSGYKQILENYWILKINLQTQSNVYLLKQHSLHMLRGISPDEINGQIALNLY